MINMTCKLTAKKLGLALASQLVLRMRLHYFFYANAANTRQREASCFFVVHPSSSLSVRCPITLISRDAISPVNGAISMKHGTNIHRMSGYYWKGFQGQRSKVKVIARSNALFQQTDMHRLTAVRLSCDTISLHLVDGFPWNLPRIFTIRVGVAEKVFKVKGQGR